MLTESRMREGVLHLRGQQAQTLLVVLIRCTSRNLPGQ
jgi:hypothetical protein